MLRHDRVDSLPQPVKAPDVVGADDNGDVAGGRHFSAPSMLGYGGERSVPVGAPAPRMVPGRGFEREPDNLLQHAPAIGNSPQIAGAMNAAMLDTGNLADPQPGPQRAH